MKKTKIQDIDPHFSESSYQINRDLFKNYDPIAMGRNTHCNYDIKKCRFEVCLLSDTYFVEYPSGKVTNGQNEEFDNYSVKIFILRYLMNAKGKEKTEQWVSYKEFPDGPLYYANFHKRCLQVFAQIGNERPDSLKAYMKTLNGSPFGKGDLSWQFTVVPGVDLAWILWFGDDEFEAEAQILFEKSLVEIFNIKDLAILGDVLMISLKTFTFS